MREKVLDFLSRHNQSSSQIDEERMIKGFIEAMEDGLNREDGQLEMIPSYLPVDSAAISNEPCIVIDAGGTNFRCALASFNNGSCVITDLKKTIMAGVGKEVSKRRFYNHIAYSIKHLADRAKNIGFCFSYSIDTRPDLDGVVKGFSKEVQASSVVGTLLGQSTLDALKRYSKTPRKIAILNDTVACLMGGIASVNKEDYSTFVGYIYGTGTNISYIEKGENVIKVTPTDRKDNMVINTECGGFRGFSQGTFDKMADSMTSSQGMHLTEKMTSGRYISSVISCALYKAQEENLFTGDAVLSGKTVADTACISDFLANPDDTDNVLHKCFYGSEDRAFVRETALGIIDRAAKIGAIMVCGAMIKSGGGKEKPIGLVVEGTTFSKLYSYKERFIAYMDDFTSRYGIKYNIITGKNLNLTGTALAAALL